MRDAKQRTDDEGEQNDNQQDENEDGEVFRECMELASVFGKSFISECQMYDDKYTTAVMNLSNESESHRIFTFVLSGMFIESEIDEGIWAGRYEDCVVITDSIEGAAIELDTTEYQIRDKLWTGKECREMFDKAADMKRN